MKKLYSDFTHEEKVLMGLILKNIKGKEIIIGRHAKARMDDKGVTVKDIQETFADFSIIELHQREYSNGNTDCRILIRGKAEDYRGRNTCLSLSLETLRIITVYKNCGTDNHSTLDGDNYRNISVKEILKKLIK